MGTAIAIDQRPRAGILGQEVTLRRVANRFEQFAVRQLPESRPGRTVGFTVDRLQVLDFYLSHRLSWLGAKTRRSRDLELRPRHEIVPLTSLRRNHVAA